MTDETETEGTAGPIPRQVPMTEDGIPLVVNGQPLSETAIQALREAKARREAAGEPEALPKEINGPNRPEEPTRYGDWEKAGRVTDFS